MRLFISYARTDKAKVQGIVRILEDGGHTPWFDHKLVPFQDWQEQLHEQIRQADAFVYMLSQQSVESDWCKWEYNEAVKHGKDICPIGIGDFEYPEELQELSKLHYVDCIAGITPEATAQLMRGFETIGRKLATSLYIGSKSDMIGVPAQVDISFREPISSNTVARLTQLAVLKLSGAERANSVSISPEGKYLATCCSIPQARDDQVYIWDLEQYVVTQRYALPLAERVMFAPSGNLLACITGDDKFVINLITNELLDINSDWIEPLSSAFDSSGDLLGFGNSHGLFSLWQTSPLNHQGTYEIIPDWDFDRYEPAQGLAFSPDGKHVACALQDNIVHLWNMQDHETDHLFRDNESTLRSLAFSENGLYLASSDARGGICIWNVLTRSLIQSESRHKRGIGTKVMFSPDSSLLVISQGNKIRFWETEEFGDVYSLMIDTVERKDTPWGSLNVAISADGTLMAVSSGQSEISLWGVLAQ